MPEKLVSWECPRCSRHLEGFAILTHHARSVAAHALRVAADRFDEDAKTATEAKQSRLANQFTKQALDSRMLADTLE